MAEADGRGQSVSGCLHSLHGAYLVVAGPILGLFCWLIPALLLKVAESDLVDARQLPALAGFVLRHRVAMPLLAVPAIVLGVVAMIKVRPRWLWTTLGSLFLLLPAALLIATFVMTMALLYSQ